MSQIKATLLTGGLASGKTAVATEIGEILHETGVPYAVIDLDWLCWCGPSSDVHALLEINLSAVWQNYRAAGIRRLVLARALLEPGHLTTVRRALPDVSLTVVRLTAPASTIRQRLRSRDSGATLIGHLAELDEFTAQVEQAALEDHIVPNDGRPIREVATEVLSLVG
ncbi:hypothetical protein Aple_098100 [Acrocarpospora pleiomorpha]|uniref:Uncharacterized protein n=1 Tax=Acrocarpospora pleiomorpha TaxID=90975 RepID=A0A5M3Y4R7_9ACTN|nr:hypothetical protein [Acrocarpospora pleiomorpha]GES26911.1 hypothetical protein Aple_098100 [Acrocarpospora pleiomorpha]